MQTPPVVARGLTPASSLLLLNQIPSIWAIWVSTAICGPVLHRGSGLARGSQAPLLKPEVGPMLLKHKSAAAQETGDMVSKMPTTKVHSKFL